MEQSVRSNAEDDKKKEFLMLDMQKFVIWGFLGIMAVEFVHSFVPE